MKRLLQTLLCLFFLTSCAKKTAWKLRSDNMPFIGPSETLTAKTRYVSGLTDLMAASGNHAEYVWEDAQGRRIKPDGEIRSIEKYFIDNGMMSEFPRSGSNINDINQRVPNCRICLISVRPTIGILVPHDFGNIEGRSTYGIRGDTAPWGDGEFSPYFVDHIYTGTNFPFAEGLSWFNAHEEGRPRFLQFGTNDTAQISSGNAVVHVIKENGRILVQRTK